MTLILMAPTEIAPRANAVPLPGGAPGGIGQSHPPTGGARTGSHAVRFAFVFYLNLGATMTMQASPGTHI